VKNPTPSLGPQDSREILEKNDWSEGAVDFDMDVSTVPEPARNGAGTPDVMIRWRLEIRARAIGE